MPELLVARKPGAPGRGRPTFQKAPLTRGEGNEDIRQGNPRQEPWKRTSSPKAKMPICHEEEREHWNMKGNRGQEARYDKSCRVSEAACRGGTRVEVEDVEVQVPVPRLCRIEPRAPRHQLGVGARVVVDSV